MRFQPRLFVILIGLLASGMSAARAVDVYSNLGNPDSSANAAIGYNDSTNFNVFYAQGFTTGASLYNMKSVGLALGVTNAGNGSPQLQIYSDNPGVPGSDLGAVFTNPSFGTRAIYNLSLSTPFALSASTRYWMVLKDTTAGSSTKFNWYYSDTFSSPSAQNGSSFQSLNGARSVNGGSNWVANTAFSQTGISIDATAVPEPSTYALAAIATGVMAAVARRRKARNA
jgi:hypothetical protein